MPLFLSSAREGFGDVPDRLLERDALLEWQRAAELELAVAACPGHAQRAAAVELDVIDQRRRYEQARGARDRSGWFADRDARQLGVGLGCRDFDDGEGLVE